MLNFKLRTFLDSIRRGNWITLKMRKLIKSKKDVNRERQKSLTLTPTRSDSSEGFLQLPHQDSQDSSSVGSNSLEDGQTLGTKKSSSECFNPLINSYQFRILSKYFFNILSISLFDKYFVQVFWEN